jgi:hypothetical protein
METVCPSPVDETVVKNTLRYLDPPDHPQYRLDGPLFLAGGRNASFLVQHDGGRQAPLLVYPPSRAQEDERFLPRLESPCQRLGPLCALPVPPDERVADGHDE